MMPYHHVSHRRPVAFCALASAALLLAGCNTTSTAAGPSGPAAFASAEFTPHGYALPHGKGCNVRVARYRAVIDNDVHIGQVNKQVSRTIYREIDKAAQACSAGHDARAQAMIRASEIKYGYPTTI
ncbi:MAG: hypothetical protein KGQ37_08335 [Hyphomicrobiales bacterium]|nr:hypothetical protein [Hyphomicrobiales bacterium]